MQRREDQPLNVLPSRAPSLLELMSSKHRPVCSAPPPPPCTPQQQQPCTPQQQQPPRSPTRGRGQLQAKRTVEMLQLQTAGGGSGLEGEREDEREDAAGCAAIDAEFENSAETVSGTDAAGAPH